jgi:hypothetical protein
MELTKQVLVQWVFIAREQEVELEVSELVDLQVEQLVAKEQEFGLVIKVLQVFSWPLLALL